MRYKEEMGFFPQTVARHWPRSPRQVVEAPSLETGKLDRAPSNLT